MSESEQIFYERYLEICKQHKIYVEQPSSELEIVGFKARRELEGVKIDDEIVKIYNGDFFVANFNDIENFLIDGSIYLV